VPSFIDELSRSVSIHKSITYPILVCVALYLIIGLTGAASFQISSSSDILAILSASDQNKVLIMIVNILFPIAVLVTSVPVFAIVIRYNLVRGNLCSNRKSDILERYDSKADVNLGYAIVWASVMPWILIIPFQTKVYWRSAVP
jgi:amino acid permease